jgi:hypothetical protein
LSILSKLLAEKSWKLEFTRSYDGYDGVMDIYYVTVGLGINEDVQDTMTTEQGQNVGEKEELAFIESVVDKALAERCGTCKHWGDDSRCRVLPVVCWREKDYGCRKWEVEGE